MRCLAGHLFRRRQGAQGGHDRHLPAALGRRVRGQGGQAEHHHHRRDQEPAAQVQAGAPRHPDALHQRGQGLAQARRAERLLAHIERALAHAHQLCRLSAPQTRQIKRSTATAATHQHRINNNNNKQQQGEQLAHGRHAKVRQQTAEQRAVHHSQVESGGHLATLRERGQRRDARQVASAATKGCEQRVADSSRRCQAIVVVHALGIKRQPDAFAQEQQQQQQ